MAVSKYHTYTVNDIIFYSLVGSWFACKPLSCRYLSNYSMGCCNGKLLLCHQWLVTIATFPTLRTAWFKTRHWCRVALQISNNAIFAKYRLGLLPHLHASMCCDRQKSAIFCSLLCPNNVVVSRNNYSLEQDCRFDVCMTKGSELAIEGNIVSYIKACSKAIKGFSCDWRSYCKAGKSSATFFFPDGFRLAGVSLYSYCCPSVGLHAKLQNSQHAELQTMASIVIELTQRDHSLTFWLRYCDIGAIDGALSIRGALHSSCSCDVTYNRRSTSPKNTVTKFFLSWYSTRV